MTVQLTLGIPGNVGHHWRTKWALSGNQDGEGNGLAELAGVVGGGVKPKAEAVTDAAA